VYGPTVNTKWIQGPTTPCDSNKHSVSFEPNRRTSKTDANFETSPKLYRAKLREGEKFDRQHGYGSPRLQPVMLRRKASLPFLANPIESNSNSIEGRIKGWSINESEHHEHRQHVKTCPHQS